MTLSCGQLVDSVAMAGVVFFCWVYKLYLKLYITVKLVSRVIIKMFKIYSVLQYTVSKKVTEEFLITDFIHFQ